MRHAVQKYNIEKIKYLVREISVSNNNKYRSQNGSTESISNVVSTCGIILNSIHGTLFALPK